jgi:hypothetical protein
MDRATACSSALIIRQSGEGWQADLLLLPFCILSSEMQTFKQRGQIVHGAKALALVAERLG